MSAIDLIRSKAVELSAADDINDEILALVGDARFVLIGEASHGTHEFYQCRAEITKRLIAEKGFSAVAVEADFPDAYRVNRFVRGVGSDQNGERSALAISSVSRSGCGAIRKFWILSDGCRNFTTINFETEQRSDFTALIYTACMLRWKRF